MTNETYEEWKKRKLEEQKRKTHGAEEVQDDGLYFLKAAINRICFNRALRYIRLYFIPPDLAAEHPDAVALYGYNTIMISKLFFEEHGLDDAVVTAMYHEMVHAYCDAKQIMDTKDEKHLKAFADACVANGGICEYAGPVDGFSDARLTPENLAKVRAEL